VGGLEDEPRVDEPMALDEAVLLLALAGRAVSIVLPARRLADPTCRSKAADVVERCGQRVHAAGFRFGLVGMTDTFALASSSA
jgi:hypothetical protein